MDHNYDFVIIGTGVGGGTLAYALRNSGAKILLIERGDYLPQESENWDPMAVFKDKRYKPDELWETSEGTTFQPGVHYYVGGNTKVFGACFPRMRQEDFEDLEHEGGTAPAWPIDYKTLEPYYNRAEEIYRVHADTTDDPTEPPRSTGFPFPPVPDEPYISDLRDRLKRQGVQPFYVPIGIDLREGGKCIRCKTCDGFPCKMLAKSDSDVCCVRPALESPDVTMMTNSFARRLLLDGAAKNVIALEVQKGGEVFQIKAGRFIVSCGAVNSTALLLRSGNERDEPIANSSGMVGGNYMAHNNTALMAIDPRRKNDVLYQKTLAVNDFYLNGPDWPYPLGNLQLIGKLQAGMLTAAKPLVPKSILQAMAGRSVDWWVMSEDLPEPENRVVLTSKGRIRVFRKFNNMASHHRLIKTAKEMMKSAGYPIVLTQIMGIETNSHQCGTMRFGDDPATSVLDTHCRTHDIENLYVVDASFFPSSTAVNPALTIAAQTLRVADHLLA